MNEINYKEICDAVILLTDICVSAFDMEESSCDVPVQEGEYVCTFRVTPDFRKGQRHVLRLVRELIETSIKEYNLNIKQ